MSAARPKIADYPFTTLQPNLGVVRGDDYDFVVADVPGLIEGAAQGKGLGHEFLRHVERTAIIVHVVDMTGGYEGRDPVDDYHIINRELELYSSEFASRPRIVVANKVDAPGIEDSLERLRKTVEQDSLAAAGGDEFASSPIERKLFCTSAVTGQGIESLKAACATLVHELREAARAAEQSQPHYDHIWEHRRQQRERQFRVERLSAGVYRVEGTQVERMVVQTDWENDEAIAFLQHRLKRLGVERELEAAGARDGDEVRIVGRAFEFESSQVHEDIFRGLDI